MAKKNDRTPEQIASGQIESTWPLEIPRRVKPARKKESGETPEQAAMRRIEEAARTGAKELDLSKIGKVTLPENIGSLTALTKLNLSNTQLASLPESIGNLTALTTLNLTHNQLASLPESVGKLTALTALDLRGNLLTSLPESIGNLTAIPKLDLSYNRLTTLPESIGNLTALTALDLRGNRLTGLPESVGKLTALTALDLCDNQLITLPEVVTKLTALTTLDLRGNRLTSLPESIGNLTTIPKLDLSHNRLATLPESIGNLTALKTLELIANQLTGLPESVEKLTALTALDLRDNQLITLPEVVTKLTALTTLDLRGNRLTSLPESIGSLAALKTLHLSFNKIINIPHTFGRLVHLGILNLTNNLLATLPETFGDLSTLISLDLSSNQLTDIPETIGNLAALKTLDLSNNKLLYIPKSIINISSLCRLFLHNNPQLSLPPEVLGLGADEIDARKPANDPRAILSFYFASKNQGKRPLAEAKVLVVGQGSVGKTSLIKHWRTGKVCDGTEEKTTRIDITRTTLSVQRPDGGGTLDIALNVWDFGGQEIYHATHQFFLSRRSLYLLVLDARLTEDQNNIHYWLQVIRSYGADSPVIVIINKSDQHYLELNETRIRKEYGEQFVGVLRVSCKTPFGRDELTEAVRMQLAKMRHVFDTLPASYFEVKAELEKKSKKENFLTYSEYEKLCKRKELKEAIDQTTLIRFLHDLGVVLNFNDEKNPYKLQHTAILNPEWVTRGVYAILNDHRVTQAHGKLTRDHLNRILSDDKYPADKKDVIIGMMYRFELCFDFPAAEIDHWLIPGMLYAREPDLNWLERKSLNFQYHYEVLPIGLISRFIVRVHKLVANETYWQSGAVLNIEGNRVLIRGDTAKGKIFVTVQGAVDGRRAALAVVRHQFHDLHATIPGLVVASKVPLPDNPDVVVDFDHLLKLEGLGHTSYFPEGARREYQVRELLNGVSTAKERDEARRQGDIHNHFYREAKVNQNSGNNSGNISNSTITGSTLNWGTISGNVTNLVKQLPVKRKDGPDLKAVLDAFLAALKEATEKQDLPADDAKDAIEEVEVIAEAAAKPDEPKMLEKANKAVRGLGRIVGGVSALATQAKALGDAVTGWFS